MERTRQDVDLYTQDGFWNLRWRENSRSRFDADDLAPESVMTIGDFVQNTFVPEHVATKGISGKTHFRAILKHVLTPEEVDGIFRPGAVKPRTKLRAVPDWPYLGTVRLCDARPDHVQRLISAALAHGYSTQTVMHIRNVVSAIFSHARKKRWFTGDNPSSLVTLPEMMRKEAHTLTLAQAKEVLGAMRYPEKEITLIAILTRMNVAEICGLQWKRVNLTGDWIHTDGEPIPPKTIAVRKQWHQSEFNDVGRKCRHRDLTIPAALFPILMELNRRMEFNGPDDFVIGSRTGMPMNPNNIAAHRLKPIGKDLQMPWLSWHVLSRTRTSLAYELGMHFLGNRVAECG